MTLLPSPDLSVIIVSWNVAALLRDCLRSVVRSQAPGVRSQESGELIADSCFLTSEIIVVDNASADGSAAMVRVEFPAVRLIVNAENLGFARGNNQGIRVSGGRYVVLLNSDTIVPSGALATLVAFMDAHPTAGAVGPRLLRPDGTPQPYAFGGDPTLRYLLARGVNRLIFRRPLHDWVTDAVQEVDWVSGACLMVRRAAMDQVGLLDENIFMYFEDNDWCLRIRQAGWRVVFNPHVAITHIGGQSLAQNPAARRAYRDSLRYFYAKHYGPTAGLLLRLLLPFYARLTASA